MPYQSEIRASQVRELLEKVRKQNFKTYLRSVRIDNVRMFHGARVNFDFPVTAIVGPNGSGKTTILGICACAYAPAKPTDIFRRSKIGDEAMDNWKATFDAIEKSRNRTGLEEISLHYSQHVWTIEPKIERQVSFLRLNRTVPATDNPQFKFRKKLTRGSYNSRKVTIEQSDVPNIAHIK